MTTTEKISAIRAACCKINPDFYSFYMTHDQSGLEHGSSTGFRGHWEKVESFENIPKRLQNVDGAWRSHWEDDRKCGLADVLNAIAYTDYVVCITSSERFEMLDKIKNEWVPQNKTWLLVADDLARQAPETISFIHQILFGK